MFVVFSPRTYTSPRDTFSKPVSALSSVDLPAPFGPTIAVIFLAQTASETSMMIGGPPYPAVTPSARSTISAAGSVMALVHSEIGIDHPRVVAQAGEWPLRDDLTEIHHHNLVAGLTDEREIVLDHDHRAALAG